MLALAVDLEIVLWYALFIYEEKGRWVGRKRKADGDTLLSSQFPNLTFDFFLVPQLTQSTHDFDIGGLHKYLLGVCKFRTFTHMGGTKKAQPT